MSFERPNHLIFVQAMGKNIRARDFSSTERNSSRTLMLCIVRWCTHFNIVKMACYLFVKNLFIIFCLYVYFDLLLYFFIFLCRQNNEEFHRKTGYLNVCPSIYIFLPALLLKVAQSWHGTKYISYQAYLDGHVWGI